MAFFKVDKNIFTVIKEHNLTASEFELLIALISLSDNEQGVCFASNKTLGKMINKSEKYVSKIISKLVLKQVINLKLIQKGKQLTINKKDYTTYRLITVMGVTQMDNTPLTQMDNPPLTQMDNQYRLKETKTKITNTNLSSKTMDNNVKAKQKVKSKKKLQREITTKHKKLFKYAMELIKNRKSVGNKKAYALTIVINWLKAGLNTVEKVEEDKAKHSQIKSNHVFIEKVPSCVNTKGTKTTAKVDPQIYADIDRLMAKLCN